MSESKSNNGKGSKGIRGKKRESGRARRKRLLKEREEGFDTTPLSLLDLTQKPEYDSFKDKNMQSFFSQPHVRNELARSGLIRPIDSPLGGDAEQLWVPTDAPKKIFYTKKDPVVAKRLNSLATSPLSVLIKREGDESPEPLDITHKVDPNEKRRIPMLKKKTKNQKSSKSVPNSPSSKSKDSHSSSQSPDLSFTTGSQLKDRYGEWKQAEINAASMNVSQSDSKLSGIDYLNDTAASNVTTGEDGMDSSNLRKPPRVMRRATQSMKEMAIALGASDNDSVADFLANDSEVANLWSSEKRKTHFLVSTWGKLQERDRARAAAEKYVKRTSSRSQVPTQKKKKKAVHDRSSSYVVLKEMNAKKKLNEEAADEAEKTAQRLQMTASDEEDRRIRTMRAGANSRIESGNLKHCLSTEYTPDLFGTRGNYFESLMYMARMTPAREHKSKNPWDLIKEEKIDTAKETGVIKGLPAKQTLAMSICNLTWNPRERQDVLEEGALDALAVLAKIPNELIRLRCAIAYHNLSRSPKCRIEILENKHAVSLLVDLCKTEEISEVVTEDENGNSSSIKKGERETLVQLHAVSALANLSCVPGSEPQLLERGVLHVAVRMTKSQEHELVETGVRIIFNMSVMGPDNPGGYDGLQQVVQHCVGIAQAQLIGSTNIKLISRAICNLTNIIGQRPRLVTEGVVAAASRLLSNVHPECTRNVVLSLLNLSTSKGEIRSTMLRQGVVNILLGLVTSKRQSLSSSNMTPEEQQWEIENRQRSIMALSTLSTGGRQNASAEAEEENEERGITEQVLPIVLSLAKVGDTASRFRCSSALRSLSMTRSNLQLLLDAGSLTICFDIMRVERNGRNNGLTAPEFNCMVVICNMLQDAGVRTDTIKAGAVTAILPSLRDNQHAALDLCSSTLFQLVEAKDSVAWEAAASEQSITAMLSLSRIGSASTVWRSVASLSSLTADENVRKSLVGSQTMREKTLTVLVALLGAEDNQATGSNDTLPPRAAAMVRRCAVVALANLAQLDDDSLRFDIARRAIDRLIPMATSGDTLTKMWLISLFCLISFSPAACSEITQKGGCTALCVLSNLSDPSAAAQCSVAFQNMSSADDVNGNSNAGDIRRRMVKDGVVVSLLGLCSSHVESTRLNCVSAMCNIACLRGSENVIAKQGAISELMIVALVRAITDKTKVVCAQTLMNLLVESTADFMIREGLIWALSELSKLKGYPGVVRAAAVAFAVIVANPQSRERLIQEKGAIHSLMKLLRIDDQETRSLCWSTFGKIIDSSKQEKPLIKKSDDEYLSDDEPKGNVVMSRLVEEGVLSALAAIVKSDDETLKTNSAALLALLCTEEKKVRRETGGQAMQLVAALAEQDLANESARQYCVDALHALAADPQTRHLLNDPQNISGAGISNINVLKILLALAKNAESTHTEVLCAGTLYHIANGVLDESKSGGKPTEMEIYQDSQGQVNDSIHALAVSENLVPLIRVLADNCRDNTQPLMLMAVIRSVSWDREAAPYLVRQGIIVLLASLLDTAGENEIGHAARLDCAAACRNFAEACGLFMQGQKPTGIPADDLLAKMDSEGAVDHVLYRILEGEERSLEIRQYFTQTLCWMTSSPLACRQMLGRAEEDQEGKSQGNNVVARLSKMLHGGGPALTRESVVALHYLALQKEGPRVLLEEGVFDTVTTLGTHSDEIIRFSCEAVLALLSPLLTGVRKGTLSKVIALCLNDDQEKKSSSGKPTYNLLGEVVEDKSSTEPVLPKKACHDRPGTWSKSRKLFSSTIFSKMVARAPQETPFTKLSKDFRAPEWEKVHFPSLKVKPEVPEPPKIVKPLTNKISIVAQASSDVSINVEGGPASEDADRMDFTKDEPVVDQCWDDEQIATDHAKILHHRRNDRLSEFGVELKQQKEEEKKSEKKSGGLRMPKIGKKKNKFF